MNTSRSGSPQDKLDSIMSRRKKRLDRLGVASEGFIAADDPRYEAFVKVDRAAQRATAAAIASDTVPKNRHWRGNPPESEIRTLEDLAGYIDRERRAVDGLTHDDARGPKNQIALEIAIQAIENVHLLLDELLGPTGYPVWNREPRDVRDANRALAEIAELVVGEITARQAANSKGQSDSESDNSEKTKKEKRLRTPVLVRCGCWVKEHMADDPTLTKNEAVEQFVESTGEGTVSTLIRGLSDYPDLWK